MLLVAESNDTKATLRQQSIRVVAVIAPDVAKEYHNSEPVSASLILMFNYLNVAVWSKREGCSHTAHDHEMNVTAWTGACVKGMLRED